MLARFSCLVQITGPLTITFPQLFIQSSKVGVDSFQSTAVPCLFAQDILKFSPLSLVKIMPSLTGHAVVQRVYGYGLSWTVAGGGMVYAIQCAQIGSPGPSASERAHSLAM
jgi:hypothetical protein